MWKALFDFSGKISEGNVAKSEHTMYDNANDRENFNYYLDGFNYETYNAENNRANTNTPYIIGGVLVLSLIVLVIFKLKK